MAYHQMQNCLQMIHLYFRLYTMLTLLQMNEIMICFKLINGLSNGFDPDPSKQAQEITFSRKRCYNSIFSQSPYQKHLCIFLDARLTFEEHLEVITIKVNKNIGLLGKLQKIFPRPVLMTMQKAFVRPHLDYRDIIYDEAYNETFHQKLESIRYNACLALSGGIRGSSREKLYHESGLESLQC